MKFNIDELVVFSPKVYAPPYKPYYDNYVEQIFKIVAFHEGDHIELECISDSNIIVNGYIHPDEILNISDYFQILSEYHNSGWQDLWLNMSEYINASNENKENFKKSFTGIIIERINKLLDYHNSIKAI